MSYVKFDDMIGKRLAAVVLSPGKGTVTFAYAEGGSRSFGVDGDCCSESWIEHLELPGDVAGATVLAVEDSDKIVSDHDAHDKVYEGTGEERYEDCIAVYNTVFRTDKGDIVLEFRNNSNGYYGGYLVNA